MLSHPTRTWFGTVRIMQVAGVLLSPLVVDGDLASFGVEFRGADPQFGGSWSGRLATKSCRELSGCKIV
jgi:hypothetical protein